MEKKYRVLAINPGSTSTKVGIYENDSMLYEGVVRHSSEDLAKCGSVLGQKTMRLELIEALVRGEGYSLEAMDAFVGRGGIVKPMPSGVYNVGSKLLNDLETLPSAHSHASALGGIFAYELGRRYGKPAFIVDPVVVDERIEVARLTGLPQVERPCVFHCLNQKAAARHYCKLNGRKYNEISLIVAHLGGGISIGAHENGVVIDVTNAITGEGPFSPERCGALPVKEVLDLCFSGRYTKEQLYAFCSKAGGFVAHMGTNSALDVEKAAIAGDPKAALLYDALAYNVAKDIGAMAAVLKGRAEAVILTGGLAYSRLLCDKITEMVGYIAPVVVYEGEGELSSLAAGAFRVLSGEEEAREYQG